MGFSVSGATAVIFIGLLVSAAALLPAMQEATSARQAGIDARDERTLEQRNTDIELTGAVYDGNGTLTVRVENTGPTSLDASVTDLLVDGEYADAATAVDGDADRALWTPASELRFVYDVDASPGRVVVVTEHGIRVATPVEEVTS